MHITRLSIERVRNIEMAALPCLQPFNVFYGPNGSGKTSVLEAIHVLATGRSFRTHLPKHYIQHQQQYALIFAQAGSDKIGIQKFASGEQLIKVNGDAVATQGQLAKLLPLQLIEPQSTDIIDHGAKPRRQLLDWLMFHVEPDFYVTWQTYSRALKQRNSLLKSKRQMSALDLEPWDALLAEYGEALHHQRASIVQRWDQFFQHDIQVLLPEVEIHLEYLSGFDEQTGLLAQLLATQDKDKERRYTEYGPHRADLRLKTRLGDADTVLSRGQKKLLIIALKLSQIAMLHASNKETVVLLDDLTAELDYAAQRRLLERLSQLGSQVFLTTLDRALLQQHLHDLCIFYQLFNVDNGKISSIQADQQHAESAVHND